MIVELLGLAISDSQIYRVTDYYGSAVSPLVNVENSLSALKEEEVLYVEADGSMILTREDSWNEVKVGRIFKSSACCKTGEKQRWISHSQYCAHLGSHKDFTKQMDSLIDMHGSLGNRLVFISDGATWIKNWVEDAFPKAISILDYYHACEYLHAFSSSYFTDKGKEKLWTDKQREWLLKGKVSRVCCLTRE